MYIKKTLPRGNVAICERGIFMNKNIYNPDSIFFIFYQEVVMDLEIYGNISIITISYCHGLKGLKGTIFQTSLETFS